MSESVHVSCNLDQSVASKEGNLVVSTQLKLGGVFHSPFQPNLLDVLTCLSFPPEYIWISIKRKPGNVQCFWQVVNLGWEWREDSSSTLHQHHWKWICVRKGDFYFGHFSIHWNMNDNLGSLKESVDPTVVKVYTRRWYILGIFSLLACHQVKLPMTRYEKLLL